eukprot:s1765_g15.t1
MTDLSGFLPAAENILVHSSLPFGQFRGDISLAQPRWECGPCHLIRRPLDGYPRPMVGAGVMRPGSGAHG